ncbi:MAG: MinD/ParA family protein [Chloroflexota bacterium]
MKDQAERLRMLADSLKQEIRQRAQIPPRGKRTTRVIAVTSGKGGVGKTNFTVNLGIAFAKRGKQVLVLDTDIGLANVDVILGLSPEFDLSHVIAGQRDVSEIIYEGPAGLKLIAGGSGFQDIVGLNELQLARFLNALESLDGTVDIILLDTGAGISKNVLNFVLAADEIIVVTTPEPTALTDAYAIIKVIVCKRPGARLKLIANRALTQKDGQAAADRLASASERFLGANLEFLGPIMDDEAVARSVRSQSPFLIDAPNSPASVCINRVADALLGTETATAQPHGVRTFFQQLARSFSTFLPNQ